MGRDWDDDGEWGIDSPHEVYDDGSWVDWGDWDADDWVNDDGDWEPPDWEDPDDEWDAAIDDDDWVY